MPENHWLCKECANTMPSPFLREKYTSTEDYLNGAELSKWMRETAFPMFRATSQYGRMFLDETNGLLAICDATNVGRDGKLKKHIYEIYHCLQITEVRFSIQPVSNTTNHVACRVYFEGYLEKYNVRIKSQIRKNAVSALIPDGEGNASFLEPADVTTFRNIYCQMVDVQIKRLKEEVLREQEEERIRQERERKQREREEKTLNLEIERAASALRDAKILFMLPESYTVEDLRRQRAALMRAFHPDNKFVSDSSYAQRINDAYELLYRDLQGNNG